MLRSLSLQLQGEPETQLPLTRPEDLIKTDDVLDLSKSLTLRLSFRNDVINKLKVSEIWPQSYSNKNKLVFLLRGGFLEFPALHS